MNFDTVGSIVAIFIGLCALAISIWQGLEVRKNYRLSVTPNISFTAIWVTGQKYAGLIIENNGLGPAIISKIEIYHDNQLVTGKSNRECIDNAMNLSGQKGTGRNLEYLVVSCSPGSVIAPGEKVPIISLSVNDQNDEEKIFLLQEVTSEIQYKIMYESFYGQKYFSFYSGESLYKELNPGRNKRSKSL